MTKNKKISVKSDSKSSKEHDSISKQSMSRKLLVQKTILLESFFLFIIFVTFYFLSPYSDIGTLSVEGTNDVFDQQVIDSSEVRSGEALWPTYFSRTEIEQEIVSSIPQVSEASLTLSGLNDFIFEIDEFDTVAYIAEDNHYMKVLENGAILEDEQTSPSGGHPVFLNFEEGEALNRIITQFEELDGTIQNLISEVELVENERNPLLVRVFMNNGNQVLASIPTFAERITLYPQMVQAVEGEHGVFDLEAGAFFVPFENDDPDSEDLDEDGEVELENIEGEG